MFSVTAQDHLSFKGIPIEGSMISFCKKLKEKGFISIGSQNNLSIFSGDFTGKEATVGVMATSDGNDVFSIAVLLPESKEWNNLVNTYDYYKKLYTRKYGNPSINKENNPAHSNSNVSLMLELYEGTVDYYSVWQVSGGSIELIISKTDDIRKGQVVIHYRDDKNAQAKLNKDLEDI